MYHYLSIIQSINLSILSNYLSIWKLHLSMLSDIWLPSMSRIQPPDWSWFRTLYQIHTEYTIISPINSGYPIIAMLCEYVVLIHNVQTVKTKVIIDYANHELIHMCMYIYKLYTYTYIYIINNIYIYLYSIPFV